MSLEKRIHYKDLFGGMKGVIAGLAVAVAALVVINYVAHLEKNPLTGRVRFMSLSHDQISTIAEVEDKEVSLKIIKLNFNNCLLVAIVFTKLVCWCAPEERSIHGVQ